MGQDGQVNALRASGFRGEIHEPGSKEFDLATNTWSLSPTIPTPRPCIALRPRGTLDVVLALKWAKSQGLHLGVRGGGHSAMLLSLIEGGVLLDMSLMRGVYVDPRAKTAVVEGGALLGDIDAETGLYKLAVPLGHAPPTGAGLALNGGFGVASRVYGVSCSNVLSYTMVLGDGSVENVDAESEHEDLYWGLAGAASAFGVVTRMVLRLHDVSNFYGGFLMWKADPDHQKWREIARWIRDVVYPHKDLSCVLYWANAPGLGPVLSCMVGFFGDTSLEEKERIIAPLRQSSALQDTIGQWTYAQMQNSLMPFLGNAPRHYEYPFFAHLHRDQVTDEFINSFPTNVIEKIPIEKLPMTLIVFDVLGGEYHTHDGPIGFGKGSDFYVLALIGWMDPGANDDGIALQRLVKSTLTRAGGVTDSYVNIVTEPDAKLSTRCGGQANVERLRKLKQQWDPDNFFTAHPFAGI